MTSGREDRLLEQVVRSIGSSGFETALFDSLREEFGVGIIAIYRHTGISDIEPYVSLGSEEPTRLRRMLNGYIMDFYVHDPLRAALLQRRDRRDYSLYSVTARDITEPRFRSRFEEFGISEKLTLIISRPDDALTLSMFRCFGHDRFSDNEVEKVLHHGGILAAAVERHLEFCRPARRGTVATLTDEFRSLQAQPRLSTREATVCAGSILGYSTEALALELAVSQHSINTYRRRAYTKLNISTRSELFALLLQRRTIDTTAPTLVHH
jgi:DNA-binding CsgD family transcriptional regulator